MRIRVITFKLIGIMLLDAIREYNQASPFVPYEIRTNGGKCVRVPHPDFVFISPRGSWVMVTDLDERPRHISTILIEEVRPLRKPVRRR